jgi:argininosuccinate lyase
VSQKRLWDKGSPVDGAVHAFTVGDDPVTDLHLVEWDCLASAAHARMLASISIIEATQLPLLLASLKEIRQEAINGKFEIPVELEDCHTAIENVLVSQHGELGKRIHAGRSRNDQVLVAMRLLVKDRLITTLTQLTTIGETLLDHAKKHLELNLPGYTHMQPAMPASVGMWAHAFGEWASDLLRRGLEVLNALDCNPLGAGSGFGVSLPIDRQMTTRLLGFARVERSPIYVQNNRGRHELRALNYFTEIGAFLEKLAWDLLLFSSREYGFCAIPLKFTTGSSIMPQKRNPDCLELLRAVGGRLRGARDELEWVTAKLPSNYHRDFQWTKAPFIRADGYLKPALAIIPSVVEELTWNTDRLSAAMTDDLYATYEVFRDVVRGKPFREAYQNVATQLSTGTFRREDLATDFGGIIATTKSDLEACAAETAEASRLISEGSARFQHALASLM